MEIRFLRQEEIGGTRSLYEEAFSRDTEKFVDYFYNTEAPGNRVAAVLNPEPVSMLHLHPVTFRVEDRKVQSYYIVAVATRLSERRKGYYRKLLEYVLNVLEEEGIPFVFLMPAAEEIYYPFGFRTIYSFGARFVKAGSGGEYSFEAVEEWTDTDTLRAEQLLYHRIHLDRSPEYIRRLLPGLKAQDGRMLRVYKNQQLVGYLRETCDDEETTVLDLIGASGEEEAVLAQRAFDLGLSGIRIEACENVPGEPCHGIFRYMFRIVNRKAFEELTGNVQRVEGIIKLKECIIKNNNLTIYPLKDERIAVREGTVNAVHCVMDIGTYLTVLIRNADLPLPAFHEVV